MDAKKLQIMHQIFGEHSTDELIKSYKIMEREYNKMSYDHPNYKKYQNKFLAMMEYMQQRLSEEKFIEVLSN